MFRLFSRKKEKNFYLPGQEIKINKTSLFNFTGRDDPLNVCKNRLVCASFAFMMIYGVIAWRLFNVGVLPNLKDSTPGLAVTTVADDDTEELSLSKNPIKRADIVDRNGAIIATSLPTVNLYAHPKKILDAKAAAVELARVLPALRYEDILDRLTKNTNYVYLKRNLSPAQQYQINALGIPGLEFENGEKRVYPHKNLFAHLLGRASIDNEGIAGIESDMNERLTQSDIPLELTIDAGVQDTIRDILSTQVQHFNAEGGVAILMDVSNSEIMAMVSLPDFDPNGSKNPSERAAFNFATKGLYEPGSVFKVFNTAMALESGKVRVADKFDATQPLKVRSSFVKDYRGENRWLSVQEILIYSSNIGSAQMALKVGSREQKDFIESLGFLKSMDIELTEKSSPLTPPKEWREDTVATVAYGYGIAVTPLHVITAFSAVMNGGIYNPPSLLKNARKTDQGRRVISFATSKSMRKLLRAVVTEGSGKKANVAGYEVAGKTGTANKLSAHGGYQDKKVMTTFVSTFPSSNPRYALLVMMDDPKVTKETHGFTTSGWNAVPTAEKIIEAIAPQLNVKANYHPDESGKARIIEAASHGESEEITGDR